MSVEGTAAPHPGALPHPWCQWQNQRRWQLKVRPPTMSWGERAGGEGGEGGEGGAPTFPHPPGTYHGARSPSKTHRASWPPQRQLQEETGRAEERLLCRCRRVRRGRQEAAPEGGGGWSLKPRLLLAPATDGTEEPEGGPSGTWWVGTPHAGTGAPRSPARLPGRACSAASLPGTPPTEVSSSGRLTGAASEWLGSVSTQPHPPGTRDHLPGPAAEWLELETPGPRPWGL